MRRRGDLGVAQPVLDALRARFPVLVESRPLVIGIDKALRIRCQYSRRRLRAALALHTGALAYLQALAWGGMRYDLDGATVASIMPAHRAHAKRRLAQTLARASDDNTCQRSRHFPLLKLNKSTQKPRQT
jgi:sRNA-binding protein